MKQSAARVASFNYVEEQLGFKIKMSVMSPDDVNEEGNSAKWSDIKLANVQMEEKRVKARIKLESLRNQLTSEVRMWTRVVEKYAKMDNLSRSQKAQTYRRTVSPTSSPVLAAT